MRKYHLCYGYIINRAFHTEKKLLKWNGLVFHWCLFRISARPCNILYIRSMAWHNWSCFVEIYIKQCKNNFWIFAGASLFYAPCKQTQQCSPTTPNTVGCYTLCPFAHPVACCCSLLGVVAQSLKPVKLFSQQLPAFLLFRDREAQQCWIRVHSYFEHCALYMVFLTFTMSYGLYPAHYALQVPTLSGVIASSWTPLPTRTQQLPTLCR